MSITTVGWVGTFAGVVTLGASVLATDLEQYRDFRLGSSTAVVAKVAGTTSARDLKTLHVRPALLQELDWRPPYNVDRSASGADSVRRVVFSFVDDQLFRMVVEYDRSRTAGMTNDDMIAALSSAYGPRGPVPSRMPVQHDVLDASTAIAQWRTADTSVVLQHSEYGDGYGLVLTSVRLEQLARKAQAAAAAIDAREAPAREAALLKGQRDAAREAAEKTRSTNKEAFKP